MICLNLYIEERTVNVKRRFRILCVYTSRNEKDLQFTFYHSLLMIKHLVMKKIGILFGQERSFPMAFIERVNSKNIENISAEPVRIEKAIQGEKTEYAVIIDRISQDVPFYRTWLKNAALTGTAVINNPFWWSADDKYFNNCLMTQVGVPVPKTAILPSYQLPTDTTDQSFSNLAYPLAWDSIFNYVG